MKMACRNAAAAAIVIAAGFASPQSQAQQNYGDDDRPASYLGGLGTYVDLDKSLTAKHGSGASAFFGQQFGHSDFFIEGQAFGQELETDRPDLTDFYRSGGGLDLVYSLNRREGFSPFLLLGGGGQYIDAVPNRDDKFGGYGDAGVGFVTAPIGLFGLRLRAEARYLYEGYKGGQGDIEYSAGLEVPLLPYERTRYVPPPPPPPVVVVQPAPPPRVVNTTTVVRESIPDTDGDGVPDNFDRCPGTARGLSVDGVGCVKAQVITLSGVNFESGKTTLTADSRRSLGETAIKLRPLANVSMEIEGHTDSQGSDAINDALSQGRAEAVRSYLIEQGVPGGKLTARGLGKRAPIADNATAEGRAQNRRVELHIGGQNSVTIPGNNARAPGRAGVDEPTNIQDIR